MQNISTITVICCWNLDKDLSDSLDKVIGGVGVASFDMVDVDDVNNVDARGLVVVLESLPLYLDVVGYDGFFEGYFLASHLINCNDILIV